MSTRSLTRRTFLGAASGMLAAGYAASPRLASRSRAAQSKNDRFALGAIGVGGQGGSIASRAMRFGDIVAVCDVGRQHAELARAQFGGKAEIYDDYRKLLQRQDIDAVTIGTPDHCHSKIVV